ncbi:MAG: lysylphosphatidylglycerol synthase transmembrane domain-containing protein [Acidimicrobiales bacterium]
MAHGAPLTPSRAATGSRWWWPTHAPRTLFLLRLLVSGALLWYLTRKVDPRRVLASWREADPYLVGAALSLQLLGVALSTLKWRLLLGTRGPAPPYRWLLGTYLSGLFVGNVLPTSIGGDAVRVAQLGRRMGSPLNAVASVFFERLTGFLALSAVSVTSVVLAAREVDTVDPRLELVSVLVTIGLTTVTAGVLVACTDARRLQRALGIALPRRLRQSVLPRAAEMVETAPRGRLLAGVLGLSLVFQLMWASMHVVAGLALDLAVPIWLFMVMSTLTDVVGLVPVFFNNVRRPRSGVHAYPGPGRHPGGDGSSARLPGPRPPADDQHTRRPHLGARQWLGRWPL